MQGKDVDALDELVNLIENGESCDITQKKISYKPVAGYTEKANTLKSNSPCELNTSSFIQPNSEKLNTVKFSRTYHHGGTDSSSEDENNQFSDKTNYSAYGKHLKVLLDFENERKSTKYKTLKYLSDGSASSSTISTPGIEHLNDISNVEFLCSKEKSQDYLSENSSINDQFFSKSETESSKSSPLNNYPKDKDSTNSDTSSPLLYPPISKKEASSSLKSSGSAGKIFYNYAEQLAGVKVINPLVTSRFLEEKTSGRQFVSIPNIESQVRGNKLSEDWFTIGVIVGSTAPKTSRKGSKYVIWKISNLQGKIEIFNLLLFKEAFKTFWKTIDGTVVGVLNPHIMDQSDTNKGEVALSVNMAQKILLIGKSPDLGTCKSRKKDGNECTMVINKSICQHCIFHVQKEYKRTISRRRELQAINSDGFNSLMKKCYERKEVSSASQIFSRVISKPSMKQSLKDKACLNKLNKSTNVSCTFTSAEKSISQPRLSFSRQRFASATVTSSLDPPKLPSPHTRAIACQSAKTVLQKFSDASLSTSTSTNEPRVLLKKFGTISYNVSKTSSAKVNAIKYVLEKGPIKKKDPNLVKTVPTSESIASLKRKFSDPKDEEAPVLKKLHETKIDEQEESKKKFHQLINMKSKHTNLVDIADTEAEEKYFSNLEKQEQLEEKMLSTFKVDCKAVRCNKCKYTAFSKSELCKQKQHSVQIIDCIKRFFKCRNCGNRTITLNPVPLRSCSQCDAMRWERAPMIKEKKVPLLVSKLSILGNNEKHVGQNLDANLNLLVPE